MAMDPAGCWNPFLKDDGAGAAATEAPAAAGSAEVEAEAGNNPFLRLAAVEAQQQEEEEGHEVVNEMKTPPPVNRRLNNVAGGGSNNRNSQAEFLNLLTVTTPEPPRESEGGYGDSPKTEGGAAEASGGYKQKASFFSSFARNTVSKHQSKARYKDDSYDLDLTYITPRIIAMSFPAKGAEAIYRNKLGDVAAFLKEKHGDKFCIINCAEKSYSSDNLCDQVFDYGWPDHMAAPLERLVAAVQTMDNWNRSDPEHVVVVHCKGGKGRTGLVIAAYMLMARVFLDVDLAMEHFAVKRFNSTDRTKTGITQESQRRYCRYFQQVIQSKLKVRERKLFVKDMVISMVPNYDKKGGCKPVVKLSEFPSGTTQASQFFQWPMDGVEGDDHHFHAEDGKVVIPLNILMEKADLLVTVYHRHQPSLRKETHDPMFRCQFNSMAMTGDNANSLTLTKPDLDDTKPEDKRFPDECTVTFNFDLSRTPEDASTDNYGEALCQRYQASGQGNSWVQESSAAFFDNVRSTPEVLSKDDKKGWKALKSRVKEGTITSDLKATEMNMTDAQRMEVMSMVRDGVMSVDQAYQKVLDTENALRESAKAESAAATPAPKSMSDRDSGSEAKFGPGFEMANLKIIEPGEMPVTPRAAQPTRPAGGSKKKPPARPSRRPSVHEIEGGALPFSSEALAAVAAPPKPLTVPTLTASQVPSPFGSPDCPPVSPLPPGGSRPTSTNPFL